MAARRRRLVDEDRTRQFKRHDEREDGQRSGHDRPTHDDSYSHAASFSHPSLTVSRVAGRGNQPVKVAMLQQMQHTHGNRAVQRFAKGSATTQAAPEDLASRIQSRSGGGSSLDASVQRRLENGLGTDLSGVRVHTDNEADHLARQVDATAFTTGQDIFFRKGAYEPSSGSGLGLLAHEVTHTVQQAQGPVAGTPTAGGVSVSDPSDSYEQEAEQVAGNITSPAAVPASGAGNGATGGTSVQRLMQEGVAPPVQRLAIQRHPSGAPLLEKKEEAINDANTPPPAQKILERIMKALGIGQDKVGQKKPDEEDASKVAQNNAEKLEGKAQEITEVPNSASADKPAPNPVSPFFMELARAQELLQKYAGNATTIVPGSIVTLENNDAIWAKYDEVCMADSITNFNVNPSRTWAAGDAKALFPFGLNGFAWKGTVYVSKQTTLATTTVHEMLHINADSGWRAAVGDQINEGATEHLSVLALKDGGVEVPDWAYKEEVKLVTKLAEVVGINTLKTAYFGGAKSLISAVENAKGKGSWAKLKSYADLKNFGEAEKLLNGPKQDEEEEGTNKPGAKGVAPNAANNGGNGNNGGKK